MIAVEWKVGSESTTTIATMSTIPRFLTVLATRGVGIRSYFQCRSVLRTDKVCQTKPVFDGSYQQELLLGIAVEERQYFLPHHLVGNANTQQVGSDIV